MLNENGDDYDDDNTNNNYEQMNKMKNIYII